MSAISKKITSTNGTKIRKKKPYLFLIVLLIKLISPKRRSTLPYILLFVITGSSKILATPFVWIIISLFLFSMSIILWVTILPL